MAIETTTVIVAVDTTVIATGPPTTVVRTDDTTTIVATATTGPQGPAGDDGPAGAQGPAGPAGPAGADGGSYSHDQVLPSATWIVAHNLGYRPGGIVVIDSAGSQVEGQITHDSANQLTLTFSSAFAGAAYLS